MGMAFAGFAGVWTPVARARLLVRKPLRVIVAGEAIVLFRDGAGGVGALLDRCPHRGVALSLGRVGRDGALECAFHGWRFAADGSNRGVPLNPDARCATLGAAALPVREIGELIWIHTSLDPGAAPDPRPPPSLVEPGLRRSYIEREWNCHWTRAMENMLDSPHLPFVHQRTIGRFLRRRLKPDSRMEIAWEDTEFGGRSWASLDGVSGGGILEYHRPNLMVLHIPVPRRRLSIHAIAIPTTPGATRLMVGMSRDFARSPLFEPFFARMNGRIADEDRAVVESSGAEPVSLSGPERSVATDRATLQFRRYYCTELALSG